MLSRRAINESDSAPQHVYDAISKKVAAVVEQIAEPRQMRLDGTAPGAALSQVERVWGWRQRCSARRRSTPTHEAGVQFRSSEPRLNTVRLLG
jgi:hypothetical protein